MATAEQQPKGILKNSSSFEHPQGAEASKKDRGMKWDEMNILSTYHPADKDYGHMKITDPPTPYNYEYEKDEKAEEDEEELDPDSLASRLEGMRPKRSPRVSGGESTDSESDEALTEDAKKHKKVFEAKRKNHYNEFQAVKLARKLMEEDDDEDEEDSLTPVATSEAPLANSAAADTTSTTTTQSTAHASSAPNRQQ